MGRQPLKKPKKARSNEEGEVKEENDVGDRQTWKWTISIHEKREIDRLINWGLR